MQGSDFYPVPAHKPPSDKNSFSLLAAPLILPTCAIVTGWCQRSLHVIEIVEGPPITVDERRCAVRRGDGRDRLMEVFVAENKYLTTEEVAERYRGEISVGTLRNWRAQRVGPPFVKIGKSVLYPVQALDDWDKKNLVICRASRKLSVSEGDGE